MSIRRQESRRVLVRPANLGYVSSLNFIVRVRHVGGRWVAFAAVAPSAGVTGPAR